MACCRSCTVAVSRSIWRVETPFGWRSLRGAIVDSFQGIGDEAMKLRETKSRYGWEEKETLRFESELATSALQLDVMMLL